MKNSKPVRLSPSRISSVRDCSWQYWCNYHLRLPQGANDGNRRGTICHGLLERLVNPRHRHFVQEIVDNGDVFSIPVIARYLNSYAKKEALILDQIVVNKDKTGLMTHGEEINNMILVALKEDFLGKPGDEILTEQEHIIEVNDKDKKYTIKGIIDKIFVRKNKDGEIEEVEIVDYKTSAKKFEEKKIDGNIQGLVYQFFANKMFPTAKKVNFSFLFLRFPKSPWIPVPAITKSVTEGLEYYLTYLVKFMSSFTEAHAKKNFAKYDKGNQFLCGKHGNKSYRLKGVKKEHNEPQFICAYRDPFQYYAVVDEDGNNLRSSMTEEGLNLKKDEKAVKKFYNGCPAWHAQKSNIKRDWSKLS